MDKKKLIAMVIGVALSVAGGVFGYNFKGEVCQVPDISQPQ